MPPGTLATTGRRIPDAVLFADGLGALTLGTSGSFRRQYEWHHHLTSADADSEPVDTSETISLSAKQERCHEYDKVQIVDDAQTLKGS